MHSSGSTGLPKPINVANSKLMLAPAYAQDASSFITTPFSHQFGLMAYMQALHKRRTIYCFNGRVQQTPFNLEAALRAADPDIVFIVPYALSLLVERPEGVEALKKCRSVISGGSKLPDSLGNMLTAAGVRIGQSFRPTETGNTLSSAFRPRADKAWEYLRPHPHVAPYALFRPVENADGQYQLIVLVGHKGKTMSNSDDTPGSWHTGDLFIPHTVIPNAWKFIRRKDDRITLLNGEKIAALAMEGRVRQHPLVKEAVVFGIDRAAPGLLLFKGLGTDHLTDEEFIDQVWPNIQQVNSESEAFSQISREMLVLVSEHIDCP